LTCKVFKQIAQKKGDSRENSVVSPIYLHGEAGAGKTHLLTATAHELNRLGYRVVYARAQLFADHVVAAIRAGEMRAFREAYRNCDVLIIDDVHVLSRKAATQEEFFHTFNTLHVAGKMIILSANCPPGELQHIEPRLVSRFEWGIVLSLDHPSKETKAQILTAKARAYDLVLHPKVSDFLIETFQTTHSLTRAIEALVLRSHLKPQSSLSATAQLTIASAKQLLNDLIAVEEEAAMTPDEIIHCVAEHFGVLPEDILGKAKTRDSVLPRQIAMHLCRTQLEIPFLRIGALFGRDHSTVMSSVKLIQKGIESDDNEIGVAHRAILRKMRA
jgi:chromosomal replication initiator protein